MSMLGWDGIRFDVTMIVVGAGAGTDVAVVGVGVRVEVEESDFPTMSLIVVVVTVVVVPLSILVVVKSSRCRKCDINKPTAPNDIKIKCSMLFLDFSIVVVVVVVDDAGCDCDDEERLDKLLDLPLLLLFVIFIAAILLFDSSSFSRCINQSTNVCVLSSCQIFCVPVRILTFLLHKQTT